MAHLLFRPALPFLLFQASRQRALSIKVDTETRHDDDYTMKVTHSFFGCLATSHLFFAQRENTPPSSVIDVESGYDKAHAL